MYNNFSMCMLCTYSCIRIMMYHKVVLKQRVSLETSLKLGGQLESIASVQVKPFSGDELPFFSTHPRNLI